MDDFVNYVNRYWDTYEPVILSAYVLWRLNHIHPFINGNGRTARAACYFVLCLKLKAWLPGSTTVPELLCLPQIKQKYYTALQQVDQTNENGTVNNLDPVVLLLNDVLVTQFRSIAGESGNN